MTVYFSQGPAITDDPTAGDVLECCSDINGEPEHVTYYWPFYRANRADWERDLGTPLQDLGMGVFRLRVDGFQNHRTLTLPDGGSTKAIAIDREPIPRPKTRLDVRWRGRWEKYSKTRGWIIA